MSDALESIEHLWFTARESNLSYRVVDAIESIWSAIGNEDAFDVEREELLGKIEALETKVSTLEDERDRLTAGKYAIILRRFLHTFLLLCASVPKSKH